MPPRQRRRRLPQQASFRNSLKWVALPKDMSQNAKAENADAPQSQTALLDCLRRSVAVVGILAFVVLASSVYTYTFHQERRAWTQRLEASAAHILPALAVTVEQSLAATAALSSTLTSYAAATHQTFPTVTLPDFELRASYTRVQSGSHVVRWLPLVRDETRDEWEAYALEHRHHINEALARDQALRREQDARWTTKNNDNNNKNNKDNTSVNNTTNTHDDRERILDGDSKSVVWEDGINYHNSIYSNGDVIPRGDVPRGMGTYLPNWQQSPITTDQQNQLNLDWRHVSVFGHNTLDIILSQRKAILQRAGEPSPQTFSKMKENLRLSQYRQQPNDFVDGLASYLVYPVFESVYDETSPVVGVLATSVYWKVIFSNLLPAMYQGILCVVENHNQTFAYQLDGPQATFLGMDGEWVDQRRDNDLKISLSIHEYLQERANAQNTAYRTVPLSNASDYRLTIYPSSNASRRQALCYTLAVALLFVIVCLVFVAFSCIVDRRHRVMYDSVVQKSLQAAAAERELQEFLSHEVRNPLASALTATSFVSSILNDDSNSDDHGNGHHTDYEKLNEKRHALEDLEVVHRSLDFINDFMRSMLRMHRTTLPVQDSVVDLKRDVLEPILAIQYQRSSNFRIELDCPDNFQVRSDPIRLKQVVLNLVRNASKFVEQGYVRVGGTVEDGSVVVFVQDSGPGIPWEHRSRLFLKYESWDDDCQGTGLGLHLSKSLVDTMGGHIRLDQSYESGVPGCPGARFVVQLNVPPEMPITKSMPPTPIQVGEDSNHHLRCSIQALEASSRTCGATVSTMQDSTSTFANSSRFMGLEDGPVVHVLFVDDDAMLRKLFARAVRKARPSWNVKQASSGESALRLCETESFDLIFLDQYMASTEKQLLGTETANAMRARGIEAVICGLSANDVREGFLKAGADDFILKPFPCRGPALESVLNCLVQMMPAQTPGFGDEE